MQCWSWRSTPVNRASDWEMRRANGKARYEGEACQHFISRVWAKIILLPPTRCLRQIPVRSCESGRISTSRCYSDVGVILYSSCKQAVHLMSGNTVRVTLCANIAPCARPVDSRVYHTSVVQLQGSCRELHANWRCSKSESSTFIMRDDC